MKLVVSHNLLFIIYINIDLSLKHIYILKSSLIKIYIIYIY